MNVLVAQSCPILCDPVDWSPPVSTVYWILQARILEWVAIPFSRESSWPRNWSCVFCIAGRFFTILATREAHGVHAKLLQLCVTLCDRMDWSPPGSSVHGILQAKTLEQLAISSSSGSFQSRNQIHVSMSTCIGKYFFFKTTWVRVNSGSWWWTGRPGVLQCMGSQRVEHNWGTEPNWTELRLSLRP